MPGFGVVINPHAGKNRHERERLQRFTATVRSDGLVCETESIDELEDLARDFRDRRIDVLAICGGDGSFFRALSAMVRAYGDEPLPRFLPLRAGSMNTIASSVGCRHGSPERMLASALSDYRGGRPFELTERQLIQVAGRHYGFMVGAGSIVNFLQVYYGGTGRGPWAATTCFTRTVTSAVFGTALARGVLQHVEADIDCDGERVPHRRFNVVYASSLTDIGLGFHATYLATRKPGFFHLLAGRLKATQLVLRLRRLRRGWPLEVSTLYDNLAQRVTVEFPRPTHYMIDGDVLAAVSTLEIVSGPRLTIIQK